MSESKELSVVAADVVGWTPRMVVTVRDQVDLMKQRDQFMKEVMREGLDYGVIPGTGGKPSLLKPGAERLLNAYGLHPELSDEVPPVLDLTGEQHGGETFLQFRRVCRIWRQTGPGENERMLVAQASGECNSWETKYRYRNSKPECTKCGKELRRSQREQEWYCWAKQGGCGATFPLDAITAGGRVANPDPAEQMNTILKMADKRALVAATTIATGWSDMVTQDIEDTVPDTGPPPQDDQVVDVQATVVPASSIRDRQTQAILNKLVTDMVNGKPSETHAAVLAEFGWNDGMRVTGWLPTLPDDKLTNLFGVIITADANVA